MKNLRFVISLTDKEYNSYYIADYNAKTNLIHKALSFKDEETAKNYIFLNINKENYINFKLIPII